MSESFSLSPPLASQFAGDTPRTFHLPPHAQREREKQGGERESERERASNSHTSKGDGDPFHSYEGWCPFQLPTHLPSRMVVPGVHRGGAPFISKKSSVTGCHPPSPSHPSMPCVKTQGHYCSVGHTVRSLQQK